MNDAIAGGTIVGAAQRNESTVTQHNPLPPRWLAHPPRHPAAEGSAINTAALARQKQKQEESERPRETLEKSRDFNFINLMLKSPGMGEKK